ncbi:adenylate/guanylate cyclase domain-containing protein [Thalassobius sp. S69A]|uniref:adenylate/guanylate cyclase domain-containing protein n=1 Tax=unclassified Thalassovita TaxID=2619711 RepID=UPI003C7B71F3
MTGLTRATKTAPRRRARLSDLITLGQVPHDPVHLRDLKAMSVVVVLATFCVSLSYFLVPERSDFLKIFDGVIIGVELLSLLAFWRLRSVEALFRIFVPAYLSLMGFFVLLNGTREGDVLAFLVVPCAAVVVFGPRRSVPWFWLCLIGVVGLAMLDEILPLVSLESARSAVNPQGYLFHSPWKKPLGLVEGIAFAAVTCLLYFLFRSAHRQLRRANMALGREKQQVDRLMRAVYPDHVIDRLKEKDAQTIVDHVPQASVLFADLEGFSKLADTQTPAALVRMLDVLFGEFDRLTQAHGAEKIKSLGDGYLAVAGVSQANPDHAAALCQLGAEIVRAVRDFAHREGLDLGVRVGVHSGPVIAGVMGRTRPHYDIWGGTVNLAQRLQATAPRNSVQLSGQTRALAGRALQVEGPRMLTLKGLGEVAIWTLRP